jgi:hypothetical protein
MEWFKARDISTPNSHLSPDDDVQVQIEHTMEELKTKFPTLWVKGHQEPKDDEELPWEAQLNIEADALATEARNEINEGPTTTFHQYPASRVMLYIDGQPITRNISKAIRNAWTTQDLREYMTQQFGWKKCTADNIDWYSHGSTLSSYEYYQHMFCVKLIHKRLPLLGEKFTASPIKTCPCCKVQNETFDHFLHCNKNPHRVIEIRDSLKEKFDKQEVDPILRLIIYRAISNFPISMEILEGMNPDIDFEPYKSLLQEQNEIGWDQLHLGRFGLSWDRCQRRYLEHKHQKQVTGEPKWIRHVTREIWAYHKTRWLARNETLHGTTNRWQTSIATRTALLSRIQALYKHKETLLVQDQHPFTLDIDEWETQSSSSMKQWIKTNTPFIKHALQVAHVQHKRNASDIRRFLPNFIRTPMTEARTPPTRQNRPKRGQKKSTHPPITKPPTNKESRQLYPSQYKQASILDFTNRSQTTHIAAPTI